MNSAGVVYYVLGDHLGSTAITVDGSGAKASELRYKPYGEVRYSGLPNGTGTDYRFTGQRQLAGLGLYHMGARWVDPSLGRWLSADTLVPDPANPQGLNRYSFVLGNPLKYVDPSGHIAWLVVGAVALKALDYGWTAWDTYQSGRMLANPNASRGDKMMAGLNVAVSIAFEAIEPDDLIPVGLPVDDVARKAFMKAAREAYEEGGEEALERIIRDQMGDHADEVLNKLDEAVGEICFEAGTLVQAEMGPVAIETIRVGNRVIALDLETGTTGTFTVTEVFSHEEVLVGGCGWQRPDSSDRRAPLLGGWRGVGRRGRSGSR